MEEFIDPVRIANSIMQDVNYLGCHLIVEGKKDSRLFQRFVVKDKVKIQVAFGNEKVKRVLNILDERDFQKKIGIIDKDFKEILGILEDTKGLFHTDFHDTEIMTINSSSLDGFLNICCTVDVISEFEKTSGKSVKNIILELGKEVGYLKLANKMDDLGLVFKPKIVTGNQIKYRDFTCTKTLNFKGSENLINSIINYSRNKSKIKSKEEITESYSKVREEKFDLNQLVNGHDVSNLLYILLKTVLNSKSKLLVDFNSVEDCLYLGYEYADFKKTNLFKDIEKWSEESGMGIFK